MLTVIIRHNGEDRVVKYTHDALYRELKDIPGSEILIYPTWLEGLQFMHKDNRFVCFVEADCLVSSGYFTSLLGLLDKQPEKRNIGIMGSATAVKVWVSKFYGYRVSRRYADRLLPNRESISRTPYRIQVAFVPGAVIRLTMLQRFLDTHTLPKGIEDDLALFSLYLSLGMWGQSIHNGIGSQVFINPNTTYVTTEAYVNDSLEFNPDTDIDDMPTLKEMFKKLSI